MRAEIVGKIGRNHGGRPVARNRREPADGELQKRGRRHHNHFAARKDRLEQAADQAHVMVARQPGDTDTFRRKLENFPQARQVVQQIAVRHHDAARRRGRARSVLQECQGFESRAGIAPSVRIRRGQIVGRQPMQLLQFRRALAQIFRLAPELRRRQHEPGLGIRGNGQQPRNLPVKARGKNRDRDNAGVQATPECGDEFESAGVEKQGAFSCGALRGERRRNEAGARFQFLVGQARLFILAVGEIAESDARTVLRRPCAEQVNQIGEARVTLS